MSLLYLFTALFFFLYSILFLWVGYRNYKTGLLSKAINHIPNKTTQQVHIFQNNQSAKSAITETPKKFSVLIPLRNEAKNIRELVQSLDALDFPKDNFEVLFIDDHSQDDGVELLHELIMSTKFSASILELKNPETMGKKQAITYGIEQAQFPWIITLDADSVMSEHWLSSIEQSLSNTLAEFMTGPVFLRPKKGVLFQLQASEFMSLQALTQASYSARPLLSNGTNLVYSKNIFQAVSGFSGNLNISSGDDMFLMRKILKQKTSAMAYNLELAGAVFTKTHENWRAYAAQQIRWMSKTSALKDPALWAVALVVFCTNATLVFWGLTGLIMSLIQHTNANEFVKCAAFLFAGKFLLDHTSLWLSYAKLNDSKGWSFSKINWLHQILAALIYPFWAVGLAIISTFYRPSWKGRKIQTK